MTGRGTQGA